jgi:serine/threonine-protein kinase HipA
MIKQAYVFVDGVCAGILQELERNKHYRFIYLQDYSGPSVSLEMDTKTKTYDFNRFPPFFEGLLPEGMMLEGLLRGSKIDRHDFMSQLIMVGHDLVGNVTVQEAP